MSPRRIFILAGEISGDVQSAALVSILQKERPGAFEFVGIVGRHCERVGVKNILDITDKAAIGLHAIFAFSPFFRAFNIAMRYFKQHPVDVLLCVDSPGINLPLNKRVKKRFPHIKTVFYFPPHISIWGRYQLKSMGGFDYLLFAFKNDFDAASAHLSNCIYVGHPFSLLPQNPSQSQKKEECRKNLGISEDVILLALFPGSRKKEIHGLTRIFVETSRLLKERYGSRLVVLLGLSDPRYKAAVSRYVGDSSLVRIVENQTQNLIAASDFCLSASGTINLEICLSHKPMSVCYSVNSFNFFIAMNFILYTPFIAMPNILAREEVYREFLGGDLKAPHLRDYIASILEDKNYLDELKEKSDFIRNQLCVSDHPQRIIRVFEGMEEN